MKIEEKLILTNQTKLELFKIGAANKIFYNECLKIIDVNFKHKNKFLSNQEIFNIVKSNVKESRYLEGYNLEFFKNIPIVANSHFKAFACNKKIKPVTKDVDDLNYTIYLDFESAEANGDCLFIKKDKLFLKFQAKEDLILRVDNKHFTFKSNKLRDIKIVYNGLDYYLYAEYENLKTKNYGINIVFNKNHFITSTSDINIESLTKDDIFYKRCLLLVDLEKTISYKKFHDIKVYDAEINSFNFTQTLINESIEIFVKSAIKQILSKNPEFVFLDIAYVEDNKELKDKIDCYIFKLFKNKLYLACKNRNIEYAIYNCRSESKPFEKLYL